MAVARGVALVAGVDGCRAGWVVAMAPMRGGGPPVLRVSTTIGEVLADERVRVVAIDMPIGLPVAGRRACDLGARRLVGARRSSVFPAPVRAVLGANTWEEANARSRSVAGVGLSRQAYGILRKIRELDGQLTPDVQRRVVEAHPEVCFAALAGRPMAHAKRTASGRAERIAALRSAMPAIDELASMRLRGAAPDDVLDALVLTWSARRFARRAHRTLGDGSTDSRGLRMEIVV